MGKRNGSRKRIMTLEEYIQMKEFTAIGHDYYEDAGGAIYHETNIIDEMLAEYPEEADDS